MAKLVALSKGFSGKSCEIGEKKITIGRRDDNAFPIAEGSVSGRHCEVYRKAGKIFVRDLGSTNGTFVGEKPVDGEAHIPAGMVLRVGQVDIRLETGAGAPDTGPLDKTVVLKQGGVRLDDLEQPTQSVAIGRDKLFSKKSNQINRLFLFLGIGGVVAILALLAFAVYQLTQ